MFSKIYASGYLVRGHIKEFLTSSNRGQEKDAELAAHEKKIAELMEAEVKKQKLKKGIYLAEMECDYLESGSLRNITSIKCHPLLLSSKEFSSMNRAIATDLKK